MAEHQSLQQQQLQHHPVEGIKNMLPDKGPSASQVIAVATLLPVGGILLTLSGLTLAGSVIGILLASPLFLICSPVLVPAAFAIGLAVMGFLTSGALGITGLSSLTWILNYLRSGRMPEQMEHAKRRVQDATGQIGQKTREVGQGMQGRIQEGGRT